MSLASSPKKRLLTLTTCIATALIANGCAISKEITPESTVLATQAAASESQAKNVILFIGDGMGISTITAGRIFDGQSKGMTGEEHELEFDKFDNLALVKTYNTNAQVPDSAGTATAIMSGYRTNIGAVNVPAKIIDDKSPDACNPAALPPSLAKVATDGGKSVGVISTARLTHATPAAMYSHSASRDWEADKDIKDEALENGCESIAAQLVKPTTPVNLALGGGMKEFSPEQIAAWNAQGADHTTVTSRTELMELNPAEHQDVFGLFNKSHMSFSADREGTDEPSLSELTSFAIDNLAARDTGYVLMVEAGRIDHAHHGTNAYRALTDLQALNEAVKTAKAKTGDDTLILVTADHSHVFTMAGYPVRGNPILGLVHYVDRETGLANPDPALAKDGKPYTTLGYHNGPNVRDADSPALTSNTVQAEDFRQQTAVQMGSETHGGEDVALYADGPGAQRVRGVMNQDEIHSVITQALGIKGN